MSPVPSVDDRNPETSSAGIPSGKLPPDIAEELIQAIADVEREEADAVSDT